jgi:hypothetical protein
MNFISLQPRMYRIRVAPSRSLQSGLHAFRPFFTPLLLNVSRVASTFGAVQRNQEMI